MTSSVTILSAFWIMMVSCDWADTFNMSLAVYSMYLLNYDFEWYISHILATMVIVKTCHIVTMSQNADKHLLTSSLYRDSYIAFVVTAVV